MVVGAGVAGLLCARELQRAGVETVVLEADDAPGGRVRTDVVDGFRCDRGFQLINPSYPAVRRHVDVDALDPRPFGRGVEVVRDDGVATLVDPVRRPGGLLPTLRSGYLRPGEVRELVRLARWVAPALGPVSRLLARPDAGLRDSLDAAGVTGPLRHEVLESFLRGTLADDTGATSATYVELVLRSFVRGTPFVPAAGMQALPDQLAAGLAADTLRTGAEVTAVRPDGDGVLVTGGQGEIRARAVVVATAAPTAARLTGLGTPPMRGLAAWWFDVPEPPSGSGLLRVGGRAGPVVNTAVMTTVAPSYAPAGRHLVQASTLLPSDLDEAGLRGLLERLWRTSVADWRLVVRHDVPQALPSLPPAADGAPLDVRRPVDLGGGLFVAGDHRDTPSLQGAMVSGARTARAVRRRLGVAPAA